MTPQYYSKNHSERKINEKEENIENKNYLNPKEQIKKGRQSKIKENPDSLDSDLMEAVSVYKLYFSICSELDDNSLGIILSTKIVFIT